MDLDHRHRLIRTLSQGEGRATWLAQDRLLGGMCVLKLASEGSPQAGQLELEGSRLAELEHPNLARLVHRIRAAPMQGRAERVTGFATAWVDGGPLDRELRDAPLEQILGAIGELLDALGYLHVRGLLHLDLKSENIFVADGRVVLLDLGSAEPLDAEPGRAGGTVGYAAPEVLAGQAASVASDLFSLGVLLYEVLTGERPHGQEAPAAGFNAFNDPVPMRALRPDLPRWLSELVESLLAPAPGDRPADVEAVRRCLAEQGLRCPRSPGAPPLVGREAELATLLDVLGEGQEPRPVVLAGPPGSGRHRLGRAALHLLAERGMDGLDLSTCADPRVVLTRLARVGAPDLRIPADDIGWAEAIGAGLASWTGPGLVIFLGERQRWGLAARTGLERVGPALLAAGHRLLEVRSEAGEGQLTIRPRRLGMEDLGPLLRFYGVVDRGAAREALRTSGGWPGLLVTALAHRDDVGTLEPEARMALEALQSLPAGIPRAAVLALPEPILARIAELERAKAAWWGEDRRLYIHPLEGAGPVPEELGQALLPLLECAEAREEPLWTALAAARLGREDLARRCFDGALAGVGGRLEERTELARRLANGGDLEAREALAGLLAGAGDMAGVVDLLHDAPDRRPREVLLLAQGLRHMGRVADAECLARSALSSGGSPRLWLEIAHCRLESGDLAGAEAACTEAAADPRLADSEVLAMRLRLAIDQTKKGATPPDADRLLTRVRELDRSGRVGATALSAAGRLLLALGRVDESVELGSEAARRADEEGDTRRAAGIRLNLGINLADAGRGTDARLQFQEALQLAQQASLDSLAMRIHISWASLETRSGRYPDAEAHLRAFEELAARLNERGAAERLAMARAELLLAQGVHGEARGLLESVRLEYLPQRHQVHVLLRLCDCLLTLDEVNEAGRVLERIPDPADPIDRAELSALQGRVHLARSRRHLGDAVQAIPSEPSQVHRQVVGRILLAAGGEDMDPAMIPMRRQYLDRAANYLRGVEAGRAASLRDRLLEGPGAALDGIVALTESIRDSQAFPGAVARLVRQALGAHRVLIMLRMPGLGRVTSWTELSGAEAAGIGAEVMQRIRAPGDVWISGNAFADPHLRKTSQTVRSFELKSLLAVAIARGDRAIGALYVDDNHRANRFGLEEVELLQRLARAVGELLPVVGAAELPSAPPVEPQEIYGVRTCNLEDIEEIRAVTQAIAARAASGRSLNLLITGPTGAGKTVLAERLAQEVLGLKGINRVALSRGDPEKLKSTLGDVHRGDFTQSVDRVGAINVAIREQKALFLDEVQNLDDENQQVLLPLLELPVRQFGGLVRSTRPIEKPLHVILGTNAPIRNGEWQEVFRPDLWYRMASFRLDLPPLSRRGPEAIYQYLTEFLKEELAPQPEDVLETAAIRRITSWSWPGNLRELRNFVDRAVQLWLLRKGPLKEADVDRLIEDAAVSGPPEPGLVAAPSPERFYVAEPQSRIQEYSQALRRNDYNQKLAAEELGISPSHLNKELKRYGLREDVRRRRREKQAKESP